MSRESLGAQRSPLTIVVAAFLTKLAKHLALLSCLVIVGQATGRTALGQPAILFLVICAATMHALGAAFKRRWRTNDRDRT